MYAPGKPVHTALDTYMRTFIAAFSETKTRNNPNVYQRTDELYNSHTMEYYAIMKMKKLGPHGININSMKNFKT